jgi:hypothetical protein
MRCPDYIEGGRFKGMIGRVEETGTCALEVDI